LNLQWGEIKSESQSLENKNRNKKHDAVVRIPDGMELLLLEIKKQSQWYHWPVRADFWKLVKGMMVSWKQIYGRRDLAS